jgi:hypothetical protein
VTTFLSFPSPTVTFNEMDIDRDPGAPVYVVACYETSTSLAARKILGINGRGIVSTVAGGVGGPLLGLTGIELHPRSGNYLTTDQFAPEVNLVSKNGAPTAISSFSQPNAARVGQDDTIWIAGRQHPFQILRYDLPTRSVVSMFKLGLPASDWITSIEIYGRRPLVCNQTGPATVKVNVQSRHPLAARAQYALAASFGRRPGIGPFPNAEYLNLDTTSPLFFVSALGVLPSIFHGFQGTLDASGNAGAQVNIPALPPNLGITVFVAGVIFGPKLGVIQVTNTHWFVL